jgi:hypothetical protein
VPLSSITIVIPASTDARAAEAARLGLPSLLRRRGVPTVTVHDGPLAAAPPADLYLAYGPALAVGDELSRLPAADRAHVAPRLVLVSAVDEAALVVLERGGLLAAVDATRLSDWTAPAAARIGGPKATMLAMDGAPAEPRVESSRHVLWAHPLLDSAATLVLACAERTLDGRTVDPLPVLPEPWRVTEWLRGEPRYGQARCVGPRGRRAIATFSLPPVRPFDDVGRELAITPPGVAPLLAMAELPGGSVVLLEEEPAGLPLATPGAPPTTEVALVLFGQLLGCVDGAGDGARVLRSLRPELIYWTGTPAAPVISGVVPRCEALAAQARTQMGPGIVYPFDALYAAPEVVRGQPVTAASAVFAACATLLFVLERRVPWQADGASVFEQLGRMLQGPPPLTAPLPAAVAAAVRAGLDPDPARRPTAAQLRATLT